VTGPIVTFPRALPPDVVRRPLGGDDGDVSVALVFADHAVYPMLARDRNPGEAL
jgi:hypothetical protein